MLSYEKYNKNRLAVRGDKDKYQNLIKSIGGRWNSRMRGGEGWMIPTNKEKILKNLIKSLQKTPEKKRKYHREGSDSEGSDSESISSSSVSDDEESLQ